MDGRPKSLSSYVLVDAELYCVLTRVRLTHLWALPLVWWHYLRVARQARRVRELKRTALLIENAHTIFILSIWEGQQGYLEFGTHVTKHVHAVGKAFPWIQQRQGTWQVWSTEWKIRAASKNLNWGDAREWDDALKIQAARCRPSPDTV